jgi:predicted nucleic acid-binding Zn ribbon protein
VKKLTDEVSRELGRFGPAAGMVALVEAWPGAVGPTIARNAWPARISRDRTLHVATSSSSWAFELAQLEAEVLRRLREAVGAKAPSRLRFAVGKLPELGLDDEPERSARARVNPGPEELRRGAALAAGIGDDELRNLVAKAAAQSLFAAGSDQPV